MMVGRSKRSKRFAYMLLTASNGLTTDVFLSSSLAHREWRRRNKKGRVVRLLVLDYPDDFLVEKRGGKISVLKIKDGVLYD